nr:Chain A, ABC-type uncharacterized transport system periplasmic component-like protein [Rhodothermus marinus DSM 4252]
GSHMMHTLRLFTVLSLLLTSAFTLFPETETEVTPIQQLFLIKELKPGIARIGVIWDKNAANRDEVLPQLQRASAATGIKVVVAEVASLQEVAPQFRTLLRDHQVEALWVLEESGLLGQAAARSFLIKNATQAGMPVFAPSETWLKEGACVTWRKDAEGIRLVVNKAVAEAMGITIPAKYQDRTAFLAMN